MSTAHDAGQRRSFDRYAAWYDAFNEGKDYEAEVAYILRRIEDFIDRPKRWLDIGCGTGHHVASLHSRGIAAEGVDASRAMIARAGALHPHIPFHVGMAQSFRAEGGRDVISMLFHVINYQTSDEMVRAALKEMTSHLTPKGLLVLDFWNSDAVSRDPPARRVRHVQIDGRSLFRVAIPAEDRNKRRIDVRYQFRWDSPDGVVEHEELHALRHFTEQELEGFFAEVGMKVLCCDAWMQDRPLSSDDWYGFVCARRK